ncbi:MAG: TPM domain-containing protein [Gemmataceae bacterium]
MLRRIPGLLLTAVLTGVVALTTAGPALAALDVFTVKDDAGLFSKEAIAKANAKIEQIKKRYQKDLLIETFGQAPEHIEKAAKEERPALFRKLAETRYANQGVHGVYVLISKEPRRVQVESGSKVRQKEFPDSEVTALSKTLTSQLGKNPDQALLSSVDEVARVFERTVGNTAAQGGPVTTKSLRPSGGLPVGAAGGGLWGWVCVGLVVLLVLWVVIGMIRGFTNRGAYQAGPAAHYGPGGPAMGYGAPAAGGGGFLSSMLGGMLGAGAGMWAYDTFFRGGGGPSITPPSYGGTTGGGMTGDTGVGGASAGGDWGTDASAPAGSDDAAGGDWGATDDGGGGDWGGGDDAGGGDWGGGGDGGGGGGDW